MSRDIYIKHNDNHTIFCAVSPTSKDYCEKHPIFVMYNDGSYSYQYRDSYTRHKPGILRKPRNEFTLEDLQEVIHGRETLASIWCPAYL